MTATDELALHRGISLPCAHEVRDVDREARTLVVTVSTRTQDRAGDVLEPAGAELDAYRRNPVVLWAHTYGTPPVAKTLWIKRDGDRIIAKPQFARTPMAEEIFGLYAEGFLNAWSVGFLPHETEPIVETDDDGQRRFVGYRVVRWELLEYSAVPVPANPDALTHALQDGRIRHAVLVKALEHLLIEPVTPEASGAAAPEEPGDAIDVIDPHALEIDPAELRSIVQRETATAIRRLFGKTGTHMRSQDSAARQRPVHEHLRP